MKAYNFKRYFFSSVALSIFMFASLNVAAVNFSPDEKEKLKAGQTIRKPLASSGQKGFYGGSGYTLIDAPVDVVWQAIQDFESYHRVFDATADVRQVARKGNISMIRYQMGYKMINLEYFLEVNLDEANHTMSFSLLEDKPHDIDMARGYWKLFAQPGNRTLVAYVVSAKVPMGVINLLSESTNRAVERNLIGAPHDIKKWLATASGKKYFTRTARK
jgi:ribosome-associated toxin RatA of RatAB toxin-antitoxin module